MHNQHYITYSMRRVVQYLVLGAAIISVREIENLTGNISKIAAEWKKLGKEGPIYEFTLEKVTPEMKKQMRELKYGRESFSNEELKRNRETLQKLLEENAEEDWIAGKSDSIEGRTYKQLVKAAFEKVRAEIRVIEQGSRQLRSRMITIVGGQKPWRLRE